MSKNAGAQTNVVGYFNPNTYRVNVAISELNLTVLLEPMQFVMDRQGRKINDPLFDRFVGSKMLSPEISRKPVPVIAIPAQAEARVPDSRHVVQAGVRNQQGKWQQAPEPPPLPVNTVPPPVTSSPTQGMSMDEARKRGLVGRSRPVPEDYGATETSGVPSSGEKIPPIRYAVESVAPAARAGALPKELVEQVRPDVAPLVSGLARAAVNSPDDVSLTRKTAEAAVREQQGAPGVAAFRKEVKTATRRVVAQPVKVAAPVAKAAAPKVAPKAVRKIAQPVRVTADVVTEDVVSAPAAHTESVLVGGGRADAPPAEAEEAHDNEGDAAGEAAETTPSGEKVPLFCPACSKSYSAKSQLNRHIRVKHADRASELLS